MKLILGILVMIGLMVGSYRFVDHRAYDRGYDIGIEDGREDRQSEITPIIEDAISEQHEILNDFYTLQEDYNELRSNVDDYLVSQGQDPGYNPDIKCVSAGFEYTYNGCY